MCLLGRGSRLGEEIGELVDLLNAVVAAMSEEGATGEASRKGGVVSG